MRPPVEAIFIDDLSRPDFAKNSFILAQALTTVTCGCDRVVEEYEKGLGLMRYGKALRFAGVLLVLALLAPLGWLLEGILRFNFPTPGLWVVSRLPIVASLEWQTKLLICGVVDGICVFAIIVGVFLVCNRLRRSPSGRSET